MEEMLPRIEEFQVPKDICSMLELVLVLKREGNSCASVAVSGYSFYVDILQIVLARCCLLLHD